MEVALPVVSKNLPTTTAVNSSARLSPEQAEVQRILNIEVPIIVRLASKKLPLAEVLALANGAILELDKNSEDSLHLLVNNKVIGEGEAVKVGENFGLRITAIGDLCDRLDALSR